MGAGGQAEQHHRRRPRPALAPAHAPGQLEQGDAGDGGEGGGRLVQGQRVAAPQGEGLEALAERRGERRTQVDQGGDQEQPGADAPNEDRSFPPLSCPAHCRRPYSSERTRSLGASPRCVRSHRRPAIAKPSRTPSISSPRWKPLPVGRVLGSEDATPMVFRVGVAAGQWLQLDDVVVTDRDDARRRGRPPVGHGHRDPGRPRGRPLRLRRVPHRRRRCCRPRPSRRPR